MKFNQASGKIENIRLYDNDKKAFIKGSVAWENGIITEIVPGGDGRCGMLLPGYIDVHTHGRAGVDFDSASCEEILEVCKSYAEYGVTSLVPTIASESLEQMLQAVREIKKAADTPHEGADIPAIHIEGRWLNLKKRGAHAPKFIAPLSIDELEAFVAEIHPLVPYITLAAELEGGDTFIKRALELGAVLSLGHTDAGYEETLRLFDQGIASVTHLYNAMTGLHHRDPGCVGASLFSDVYTELICDGFHIHPRMIKFTIDNKDRDRVVLITDSMMGAGCPDGEYFIAGLPVRVIGGHAVGEDGTISGSTLDMHSALLNVSDFTGLPLDECIPFAAENPARLLGLDRGSLRVGARADFVLLDDERKIKRVNIACHKA